MTAHCFVNEINTMPGLTDASGYPKMWAGSGKPFSQVIDRLVELAFERHADRKRNKTLSLDPDRGHGHLPLNGMSQ